MEHFSDDNNTHPFSEDPDSFSLRKNELEMAFLAAAVRSTDEAIVGLLPDFKIRFWNHGAEILYGYEADEIVGKPYSQLSVQPFVSPPIESRTLADLGDGVGTEGERRCKSGAVVIVTDCMTPVSNSAGQIIGYCSISRDITKAKLAANALRDSEARYRSLIDATAQIVWTNTPEGEMRGENAAWGGFTGQAVEEYQGFGWASAVHPNDAQPTVDAWRNAVATRSVFIYEHRLRRHDGVYRVFAIRAVPVLDQNGSIREWVGVHTDITEQKATEQYSKERTQLLAVSSAVGRAMTTGANLSDMLTECCDAIVKHLGAAFARVWTLSDDDSTLILKASSGMYTHIDGKHSRIPVGQFKIGTIARTLMPHLTNRVIDDDQIADQEWAKREGMVSFAGHPLIFGDRPVGVVALFSRQQLGEATVQALESVADEMAVGIERVRGEEALRESEARKRTIVESALDCIITIDERQRVVEWNPAAERTFKYTPEQAMGKRLVDLIVPKSLQRAHTQGIAHFFQTGEGPVLNRRIEVPGLRADGSEILVELTVVPISLEGRTLFTAYVRDLTEREQSAAQQRAFLRDVLLSVTEGKLRLCHTAAELPPLLKRYGEPIVLTKSGGLRQLRNAATSANGDMSEESKHDLATAASEAGMNAIVHAGGGIGTVSIGSDGTVQVRVEDQGSGISMENLPRATLSRGFSTKATLGHGLKMMLETADRLFLLTGPTGTTVVLEQELNRPLPAWL